MATYTMLAITCTFMIIGLIGVSKLQNSSNSEIDVKDFGAIGDGITDDTLAVNDAWNEACSSTGRLTFPTGNFVVQPSIFLGPCKANTVVVNVIGNVIAPSMKDWPKNVVTWIRFNNVANLIMTGTGHFKGQGMTGWWDLCKQAKTCENNPTALAFNACKGLKLLGITSDDSPRNHISINDCNGAVISNININAPANSPNTDGIDISNTNGVQINGGHIGTGDDCIAINGGSFNINITNLNCGPGHGISVGSLGRNSGRDDVVSNIRVVGCTFTSTQNGVRIKTVPGGSGSASQILFSNIRMTNVQHPILLTQFYCVEDRSRCMDIRPVVQINGVSFFNIKGTSSLPNAIEIKCSANSGSCKGITLQNINIQPINPSLKVQSFCQNADPSIVAPVFPPVVCTPTSLIEMPLNYSYDNRSQGLATTF
ncbi:Glycoside hydrolase, family 28 [Artemisia annua]|uniref:Glycoside hydrolase, family 28 n=1 Tax=Artemisia annua TaxID=35608 RepID=A0A2U1LXF2_ARTAN|nr:Glycoside hydrolase, family 28 [Artemisia annua]